MELQEKRKPQETPLIEDSTSVFFEVLHEIKESQEVSCENKR